MVNDDIVLMDPDTKITCDHQEIKNWIGNHKGVPAIFDDPEAEGDKVGIRIDFAGKLDEKYMQEAVKTKQVKWKVFFEIFEKRKLAFVYSTKDEPKDVTMAYKFIPRESIDTI